MLEDPKRLDLAGGKVVLLWNRQDDHVVFLMEVNHITCVYRSLFPSVPMTRLYHCSPDSSEVKGTVFADFTMGKLHLDLEWEFQETGTESFHDEVDF